MGLNQRINEWTNQQIRRLAFSVFHFTRGMICHTVLFLWMGLSIFAVLTGCNEPKERNPVVPPTKELPDEKTVLLKYHPAEFLTTEIESAPRLSQANHPHGWQKADCTRCHRTPTTIDVSVCSGCHGKNGVNNQVDTCQSCHKVQSTFGNPPDEIHKAHVLEGPKAQNCVACHPNPTLKSNVHANGVVNVVLAQGGKFTDVQTASGLKKGCSGIACHETRAWEGGSCAACHGDPPDTGRHKIHLSQPDLTCRDCHAGNQHDDDKTSGTIEVGGITYNSITGDCTSTCHGNETLKWGCTSCHEYPPKDGNHDAGVHEFSCNQCHSDHTHSYLAAVRPLDFQNAAVSFARGGCYHDDTNDGMANGTCSGTGCHEDRVWGTSCSDCHGYPPSTGTHTLHVVQQRLKCQDCHAGNQHDFDNRSGVIEVGGKLTSYDQFTGDCTSSCHQPQRWDCTSCHGYPPESGTHDSHNRPEGNFLKRGRVACNFCHADHQHSYNAAVDARNFTNVRVTFAEGGNFNPATQTCSGTGCHEPFVWGSHCEDCHGEPPSTGEHLVHMGKDDITCDTCHKGRQHDLDVTSGSIDVAGDLISAYNSLKGDCTTSCHSRVEQWGCQSCHGYPPLTGQHPIHAVDLKFECHICHSDHKHSFKAATMPNDQRDATVKFTVRGVWNPRTQTCTEVGCHGNMMW